MKATTRPAVAAAGLPAAGPLGLRPSGAPGLRPSGWWTTRLPFVRHLA
jgi:hypothetical protein